MEIRDRIRSTPLAAWLPVFDSQLQTVAGLANVDGCVVLHRDLRVIGFGGRILVSDEDTSRSDFAAGRISAEELDQLTKEGLFDLFRQGADYLDSFNDQVQKATLEMSNVPRGFRQAQLAFEAAGTPDVRRVDLPLVNARAVGEAAAEAFQAALDSAQLLPRGGDGAALPVDFAACCRDQRSELAKIADGLDSRMPLLSDARGGRPTSVVTNQATYNIVVQGANKSGEQLLDEIQAAAERRSGAGGVTFVMRPG